MANMYEYYATKNVRPTYADFADNSVLAKYVGMRENMFHRLSLPPAVFAGKSLIEFGPDTGENALVFAKWGARLTLVEPSVDAHPYIADYFSKFGMDASLDAMVSTSLLEFETDKTFDIIDAEGFIYTLKPNSAWIKKTRELMVDNGLLIISYLELYGSFFELLLKAIYKRVISDSAYPSGMETAKLLFLPKWNSIPHTRKIESWFMDVIENPFVRRKYFIESKELLNDMHAGGFRLYSSWPNYRDMLDMCWIKATLDPKDELYASISFIEQSRLGHMLGRKCFLSEASQELERDLATLIRITDELVDAWSLDACIEAMKCIDNIVGLIKVKNVIIAQDRSSVVNEIMGMIKSIFYLMRLDEVGRLVEFCSTDKTFISTWGSPNHYAIFQRIV